MKKIVTVIFFIFSILEGGSTICSDENSAKEIEKILKKRNDPNCMLILANKYMKDGKIGKGFMYLSKAYEIDPKRVENDRSSKVLKLALTLNSLAEGAKKNSSIEAWNYLGDRYFEMKVFPEAKDAYANSLKIDSSQNEIRILFAITLKSLNQYYRAVSELNKVIMSDSGNIHAHYYIGKILKNNIGDRKKANRHFKLAIKLLKEKKHNLKNDEILFLIKDLTKELL